MFQFFQNKCNYFEDQTVIHIKKIKMTPVFVGWNQPSENQHSMYFNIHKKTLAFIN